MMDSNEKCLAITDADFPRSAAVYAWVDACGELVVEYRKENEHSGHEETVRRAVVDAKRLLRWRPIIRSRSVSCLRC